MTTELDDFSQAFVDSASEGKTALDIGAAYGVATLPALNRGATVYANDLDARHLEILKTRASNSEHLHLDTSEFPKFSHFPDNFFDLILCCRVLHFFDAEQITLAFKEFHRLLKKGGKLFVVCESPYLKNFQTFIPIYEENKRRGLRFPGFIPNVMDVAPDRGKTLPKSMHLLDADVFADLCRESSLNLEKCSFFSRPKFPADIQLDGRESVGLIARR